MEDGGWKEGSLEGVRPVLWPDCRLEWMNERPRG